MQFFVHETLGFFVQLISVQQWYIQKWMYQWNILRFFTCNNCKYG